MPPPKFSLPSSLASHCRSLLSRPAAASTTTAARFISTTAPKPVPPNTPFSPAQFLEGLDRPSPSPSSPGRGGGGSGGGGGLRSNDEFWSMGGNRGGWRGGGNKPEPRREPAAADLIRMLAATSSMGSSQQQQAQRTAQARADAAEALRARDQNNAYVRHMPRRWAAGEVYSPHDLSPEEIGRYFKRELKPRFDVFDVLGFNPLDNYAVCFFFLSLFMPSLVAAIPHPRHACGKLLRLPPTELLRHLRIHNAHGPHKAPRRDRPSPRQPQEDGQGHKEGHRSWPTPQCAQAPRNHPSPEEECAGT
ncbi:hypothetical protein RB600_003279 [Gaeumannomyces tritici]